MALAQIAGVILFLISLPGVLINFYVFYKLSKKPSKFDGFQKLCIAKTIPNMIVCSTFLFWSTPLCLMNPAHKSIPRDLNTLLGQIAGWGAYIFGPLVQVGLAINRFYVLYFPIQSMKLFQVPITNISLFFAIIIAIFYTIIGLPNNCGFIFDPEELSWRPENSRCAQRLANFILLSVLILSIISNSFNFATFLKLLFYQVAGISSAEGKSRRRKRILLYIQSVIQDSLHLFDIINASFTFTLFDDVWYRFLTLSVSFLLIHAMDGLVMLIFHTDIHPTWLCQNWKKDPIIIVTPRFKPSAIQISLHY